MGCCCSFFNTAKSKIKIIDETPKGREFDYFRPEGKITYSIDSTYDVPVALFNVRKDSGCFSSNLFYF